MGNHAVLALSYSVNLCFREKWKTDLFQRVVFQGVEVCFRIPSARFQQVPAEFQQDSFDLLVSHIPLPPRKRLKRQTWHRLQGFFYTKYFPFSHNSVDLNIQEMAKLIYSYTSQTECRPPDDHVCFMLFWLRDKMYSLLKCSVIA